MRLMFSIWMRMITRRGKIRAFSLTVISVCLSVMMKLLLTVSSLLVVSLALRQEVEERFGEFREQFGKNYHSR